MREGQLVYTTEEDWITGTVVSVFKTLGGTQMVVVESNDVLGSLLVFDPNDLETAPIERGCPQCRHAWKEHEKEINFGNGEKLRECWVNMGMGDWCGCSKEIPDEIHVAQEELWGTTS